MKMKDFIFVTLLYFLILIVQCDIFVNNGSDAPIKMCIQKTINHLFPPNDTITLNLNSDLCEDAIFEMSTMRPYIALKNINDTSDVKLQYDGQFIICPKDPLSLKDTIYHAAGIAYDNNRSMGNSKILVITNATDTSKMFWLFWWFGFNNVIILVYEYGISKLFTSNRFAPENECGKTANLMTYQDCEEQLSLSFTNVIHQTNQYPIVFAFDDAAYAYEESYPDTLALIYVLRELSHNLNATFQSYKFGEGLKFVNWFGNTTLIVISRTSHHQLGHYTATEPLIRSDMLWLVPKAGKISNLNFGVKVFTYDLWIAVSILLICTSLIWFLIISRNGGFTFDKLCISFLNVWSLTICGNVAQFPRSLALRIILLFYLIYVIQLQFAFTSDMSTVLTTPRYDFQIRNLKELADSQLPIYIIDANEKTYFGKNDTDCELYTKLKNAMRNVTFQEYHHRLLDLQLHGNYAIFTMLENIRRVEIYENRKVEAYEIKDNSVTDVHTHRLKFLTDHYFSTTLNTFISRMIESGIHNKRKNDFYHQHRYYAEKVDKMPNDDLLTLQHLTFAFIILGFGLCTACVVFCFELLLNKYL